MVREYLQATEETIFSSADLAVMRDVFDTVKDSGAYEDHPEKLQALARTIFALYKTVSEEPERLIQMLHDPA